MKVARNTGAKHTKITQQKGKNEVDKKQKLVRENQGSN